MAKVINWVALKSEFDNFRKTDKYEGRKRQLNFAPFARNIITKLIKKNELTNEQLTALIQLFAPNCSENNFRKYLEKLELPYDDKEKIYSEFVRLRNENIVGYTGRGLHRIRGLRKEQLNSIKMLLKKVSDCKNKDDIKKVIYDFQEKNIPVVKVGIYSPWLYYLKPEICPLVTGSAKEFLNELEWSGDYAKAIDLFNQINNIIGEKDLGLFDRFLLDKVRWQRILITQKEKPYKILQDILYAIDTKPFIILSGISGTGKTQIARIISAYEVKK